MLHEVFGSGSEVPGDGEDSSSSSSHSSSSDDGSSVSADERLTACSSTCEVRDEVWRDCIMYRLKSNAVHLFPRGSSGSRFVCGREKSCEHKPVRTTIHTGSAICKQCRTGLCSQLFSLPHPNLFPLEPAVRTAALVKALGKSICSASQQWLKHSLKDSGCRPCGRHLLDASSGWRSRQRSLAAGCPRPHNARKPWLTKSPEVSDCRQA